MLNAQKRWRAAVLAIVLLQLTGGPDPDPEPHHHHHPIPNPRVHCWTWTMLPHLFPRQFDVSCFMRNFSVAIRQCHLAIAAFSRLLLGPVDPTQMSFVSLR